MSSQPAPSNAAAGYFVDQKKGEVNELKQVRIERYRHMFSHYLLDQPN
jgi:hypothetical protein